MRHFKIIFVAIAILLIIGCSGTNNYGTNSNTPPPTQSGSHHMRVSISGFAFSPKGLTIAAGDTITWHNNDNTLHTVTATSGASFDSGNLSQGSQFSRVFAQAGNIAYKCSFHPSMTGSIKVQ